MHGEIVYTELDKKMGGRLKGKRKMEDRSQQQKTWDKKESGKTKSRALSLNMHISSIGGHEVAGGEKVAGECERTLTDRWSQHAVSFD